MAEWLSGPSATVLTIPMPSDAFWSVTNADLFIVAALVLLLIEIIRATSVGDAAITNHGLSLGVLTLCIVEFVVLPGFATSTFFIITAMAVIDVVGGIVISIRAARRDFGVSGDVLGF